MHLSVLKHEQIQKKFSGEGENEELFCFPVGSKAYFQEFYNMTLNKPSTPLDPRMYSLALTSFNAEGS